MTLKNLNVFGIFKNWHLAFHLFLAIFVLSSCERNLTDGKSAQITFQFPKTNQSFKSNSALMSSSDAQSITVNSSSFTGPSASTLDEITCYYVLISGPEDSLKTNTCEITSSSGAIKNNYGIVAGGILAGNKIEVSVPSGSDRLISLVGFKSSDPSYCPGVRNIDQSKLSNPYYLGEATRVKLNPGSTQTIPIKMSLDQNKYITECKGPDFGNYGGGSSSPTLAEPDQISTYIPVASNHITQSYCFPFSIELKKNNSHVLSASSKTLLINKTTTSSTGVVSTLAGTATYSGSTDGTGAAARFNNPTGLAIDSAGVIYVADAGNHTIRKIDTSGNVITIAGLAGTSGSSDGVGSAAKFFSPSSVALDHTGNLFITDSGNQTIRKLNLSTLTVTTFAGTAGSSGSTDSIGSSASFNNPTSLAIDSTDNIYVADFQNHKIRKISPSAVVTTLAGSTQGYLDHTNPLSAQFNSPNGISVGGSGNVYVSDQNNQRIRVISASGVVSTYAGTGASGYLDSATSTAQFNTPRRMVVDTFENVYIIDSMNHAIRKISGGNVSTYAGNGVSGSADGTGASASFSYPTGLGIDISGNLYVADSGNNTIRKVVSSSNTSNIHFYNTLLGCNTNTAADETSTYTIPAGQGRLVGFFKSNSIAGTYESYIITDTASVMLPSSSQQYIVKTQPTGYANSLLSTVTNGVFTNFSCLEVNVYGFSSAYSTAAKVGSTAANISLSYSGSGNIFFTPDCNNKTPLTGYTMNVNEVFSKFGIWTSDLTNSWSGTVTVTPSGSLSTPINIPIYH